MNPGNHAPQTTPSTPSMAAGLFVWGFGALFYLIGFFHRVAPAVITVELMRDFGISAASLGNLSALYFYSYVAMQIPTGLLADRWGARRLLTAGALIASAGTVLFAMAANMAWAGIGRFLIGGSVAVAFVGLLKVAAGWFAPRRFALLSGLALFFGVIGAVCAGTPLRILVDQFGWRAVVLCSGVATLFVGICTWLFVRDDPHEKGYRDFSDTPSVDEETSGSGIVANLFHILRYRNTVLLFLVPGGMVGCVLTFSGLWGVPYLTLLHDISPATAATLTSSLLVAWAVGGPFFGWLSDRIGKRRSPYIVGCGIAVVGWTAVVLLDGLPIHLLTPVLIVTGFASGSMIISFAYAKESVPLHLSGTVSGVVNMGVMTGPMILQPAVGWVLDRMWTGEWVAGARVYSISAYRNGFAFMLAWISISFVLLLFTRETACRQMAE